MSVNWVQLDERAQPLPLDALEETLFTHTQVTTKLTPRFPNWINGTVYVTSHRVVFVSAPSQQASKLSLATALSSGDRDAQTSREALKTASVPIERWNAQLKQPWFSANLYTGEVAPVSGGGLHEVDTDAEKPVLTVMFSNGGVEQFHAAWLTARERTQARLRQRRQERAVALGQASSMDEDEVDTLPLYEEALQS